MSAASPFYDFRSAAHQDPNPMVGFTGAWRMAIVVYLLVWKLITPLLSLVLHGTDDPYVVQRSILRVIEYGIILLPMMVPRFGGIPSGWLHPLILPTLLSELKNTIKGPIELFAPFTVWFEPLPYYMQSDALVGWSRDSVWGIMLKQDALNVVAAMSVILGFSVFKWGTVSFRQSAPRRMVPKMTAVFILCFLAFAVFLQLQGGLTAYMLSWAGGRFRAIGDLGYINGVFSGMPILLAAWYAAEPKAWRSWVFWLIVTGTLAMQFTATGSRSGAIFPLIYLLIVYIWHKRRPPLAGAIMVAVIALFAIAVLGSIRTSVWGGKASDVSYAAISEFDPQEMFKAQIEEIESRTLKSPNLPTFARVPDDVDYLWGQSYVGGFLFFIPRAIWEDKPRGIGAYAEAIIMDRARYSEGAYTGSSVSPGDVAEAYWNFDIFGVVIVFSLYGGILNWAARMLMRHPHSFVVVALYINILVDLPGPGSSFMAPFMQQTTLLLLVFWLLGVFDKPRQRAYL